MCSTCDICVGLKLSCIVLVMTLFFPFSEHDKLLKKLITECLMGSNEKILPLQIVLNKVSCVDVQVIVLYIYSSYFLIRLENTLLRCSERTACLVIQ